MAKKLEYNVDTDYQAIIDKAVSDGNLELAAEAEALRNRKIDETGANYKKTYDFIQSPLEAEQKKTSMTPSSPKNTYSPYANTDYGIVGREQMASGADWRDVLETYNSRYNKATTTEGLGQYANDEIQAEMWDYIQKAIAEENGRPHYQSSGSRPTYTSKYDGPIEALLGQILNRDDFSYDAAKDPLYQQYEQMYRREGERATQNTLADLATSAGGMNSYAVTAAQQAGNYYNSQLGDKIPELYQLAYEMYLNDKASMVEDLGLLTSMDATQYSRYRDTMSDWENDRDFAYNAYLDDYNSKWQDKEWQASQDKILTDNQEAAKEEVWKYISLGITPSADLIEKAGMNEADVSAAVELMKNETNISNQQSTQKAARDDVWKYIELGVMPSDDLIARAGMNKTDVALAIESVAMGGGLPIGGETEIDFSGTKPTGDDYLTSGLTGLILNQSQNETLQNIQAIVEVEKILDEIAKTDGKQAAYSALQELEGTINKASYDSLVAKYKP